MHGIGKLEKRRIAQRTVALILSTALVGTHVSGAFAQSEDERAGARSAATDGLQAFKDKKWAEAADLFGRAESLVHAPPHLLYLARAQINLGQLVKAQENLNKVVRDNIGASAPKAFHDAQTEAARELKELEPRMSYVKAVVSGEGKNLKVTMDGATIPPALVGVQRPVDPGEHRFQAVADGMASDVTTLRVKEQTRETITLILKPGGAVAVVAPAATTPPPTPDALPATTTPAPSSPASAELSATESSTGKGGSSGLRIASFVGFGVGVVGFGLAGAFAVSAAKAHSNADSLYDTYGCAKSGPCGTARQQQIQGRDDDANSAKKMANLGLVVGGVGLVAGLTLFLLSTSSGEKSPAPRAAQITPWVGLGSAGVSGAF